MPFISKAGPQVIGKKPKGDMTPGMPAAKKESMKTAKKANADPRMPRYS